MRRRALLSLVSVPLAGVVVLGGAVTAPAGATTSASGSSASGASGASVAALKVVDIIAGTGLEATNETFDANAVDVDNDGDLDVYVGYHDHGAKLYINDGTEHFTPLVTTAFPEFGTDGKRVDRHKCSWADVDGNGLVDAYCAVGRGGNNLVKTVRDNELWLQTSKLHFKDVGTAWGLGEACGRSHYTAFLDANGDGLPDLFVGNATPRDVADPCDDPSSPYPNEESKLFLNTGHGFSHFRTFGVGGYGGAQGAVVLDVNHDGRDDLLVPTDDGTPPQLFVNQGGVRMKDEAAAWGLTQPWTSLAAGDLDGDGKVDLVAVSDSTYAYLLNTGTRFSPPVTLGAVPGDRGRRVALGDVDGDGDLDVYGVSSNSPKNPNPPDTLFLNNHLTFVKKPVPNVGDGAGTTAVPMDLYGDGKTEFLVLNGISVAGTSQLITVR